MSTSTKIKATSGLKEAVAVSRDISEWQLAVGLLAMCLLYEFMRGPSRPGGAIRVLASDIGTLAIPMLLGWVSAKIHQSRARRRGHARTALRRNTLIAAWAFGLLLVVGLFARDSARSSPVEQQAEIAAAPRLSSAGGTTGSSAYPSGSIPTPAEIAVPAPAVDPTAAKPVVIAVVKPWIEIARMPQYVHASTPEREAIRDLYWRICVEEKIPQLQREMAYEQFVLNTAKSGVSEARPPASTTPAPSPVDAETMRRWCKH